MEQKAVDILEQNRLMALATVRADGWPQNTMVGYANDGLLLYFVISRQSQKFGNIQNDDRVSLVIGRDFHDPSTIKALSIADAHLAFRPFLAGDAFTMADIPMGCTIWRWFNLPVERPELPHVSRWFDSLRERSAYMRIVMHPLT